MPKATRRSGVPRQDGRRPRIAEPPTSFVGREPELAMLQASFEAGHRLVTVLGPGGIGKTRLALRYASIRAAHPGELFEDVFFCDLTEATTVRDLCSALARSFGVALTPSGNERDALMDLGHALDAHGPVLVLLDNVEGLAERAASAIGALLALAPALRIVATSRERLRLTGEAVLELDPLPVPDPGDAAPGRSPAVQLFVERARCVAPAWDDEDLTSHVASIVRHLDGFPLAIELCAMRLRVLAPAALLARLESGLGVIGEGPRDATDRHRTLTHVIEWSLRLLTPAERTAFEQTAVFAGGFTLEAAEAVLDLGPKAPPVLDVLEALVDKSLLRVTRVSGGRAPARFSMYSAIRDHGVRVLAESGRASACEARHTKYFLDVGDRLLRDVESGPSIDDNWLLERDNLTAVWARALAEPPDDTRATNALRAALVIDELLGTRGPFREAFESVDAALAAAARTNAPRPLVARALEARGRGHRIAGRINEAVRDLERAGSIAAAIPDRAAEARAFGSLCVTLRLGRRFDDARRAGERALERCRDLRAPRLEARALVALGGLEIEAGDLERAAELLARAEPLARRIGDAYSEALATSGIGHVFHEQGKLAEAKAAFERAITLHVASADARRAAMMTGYLACVLHESGAKEAAREGYARSVEQLAPFGNPRYEALFSACLGAVAAELGDLDEAASALDRAALHAERVADPALGLVVELHRLQMDVARHRASEALAKSRALTEKSQLVAQSDDVRFALRVLHRAIERAAAGPTGDAARLRVATTSRWFEPPGGARVPLGRKRALWLILQALADARLRAPGRVLGWEALLAAGWPGERVVPTAGAHRVRVAVATLRGVGLRDVLLSRDAGYLLDPTTPLELIPD